MRKLNAWQCLVASMVLATLWGCSGGSSSDLTDSGETGSLELAITDAEEDFLSYQVTLDEVSLQRRDGTEVSVLPLRTEIDFVQYQDLSELFAVWSVPVGVYESIILNLDYREAEIVVQDEEGNSYHATAVDSEGEPLAQVEVVLQLDRDNPIRIRPRVAAQLTLDLDLAASNTIESFDPATVLVEPFMLASASLDEEREHRVRGLLASTDLEQAEVTLNVRPMRHRSGAFGEFTFGVEATTRYEINGLEYEGDEGLNALAELDAQTPVVAFGQSEWDIEMHYVASQVVAGSSVPWAEEDVLKGVITSRDGNSLTIAGAVIEQAGQAGHFKTEVTLEVAEDTTVTGYRLGDADIANLSIGQRVLALGEFDMETDAFDAAEGLVRMKLNRLVGEVTQAFPLTLDLSHMNRRPVDVYDFAGTGAEVGQDADPDAYEIETASLDTSGIEVNEWLQVRGYPTAFGSALLDFDALSLVNPDLSSHPAKLHVIWSEESEGGLAVENDVLLLNTEDARKKLHLLGLPGSISLDMTVASICGAQSGTYALKTRGDGVHVYREFGDFVQAYATYQEDGFAAKHLTASGEYLEADQSLCADYLTLVLTTENE